MSTDTHRIHPDYKSNSLEMGTSRVMGESSSLFWTDVHRNQRTENNDVGVQILLDVYNTFCTVIDLLELVMLIWGQLQFLNQAGPAEVKLQVRECMLITDIDIDDHF